MRILHTGDWHMNNTLGRCSRTDEITDSLKQIAGYLKTEDVDVLIVAGDVFSDRSRQDQLHTAVSTLRDIFQPFLARGGTMIAISGNHDNETFFDTLRVAFDMVAPVKKGAGDTDPTGRLYIAPNPRSLRLAGRNGEVVQFVLMPYPTARAYLRDSEVRYTGVAQRNEAIQHTFLQTLDLLKNRLDQSLPSVLVSHVYVRGTGVGHALYKLTEADDIIMDVGAIPTEWAYVAYGHIHKPQQAVPNAPHVRYAGSIVRVDAGEQDDDKSVVLVEVDTAGRVGELRLLPLDCRPIVDVVIRDPDTEIATLAERYPDHATALVKFTLHWQPGIHNRDALCREICDIFPNWYNYSDVPMGTAEGQADMTMLHLRNVRQTTLDYLAQSLQNDLNRAAVLELAEALFVEEESR